MVRMRIANCKCCIHFYLHRRGTRLHTPSHTSALLRCCYCLAVVRLGCIRTFHPRHTDLRGTEGLPRTSLLELRAYMQQNVIAILFNLGAHEMRAEVLELGYFL